MASQGNTELNKGIPFIKDAFVVIVKTEWNADIVNALEEGCIREFNKHGIAHKTIVVPGAVEIPFIIKRFAEESEIRADAFIALGTVIRGDTPHFDYVCSAVTSGVSQLNLTLTVPVIFGVLTVENQQQAIERIGGSHGNKGEEAATTAIKMIALNRNLNQ